jgi:hypothetical protein
LTASWLLGCFFVVGGQSYAGTISPPIVNPANNHTYYLLGNSNCTDAQAQAVALGGDLATVRSDAENRWIFDTFAGYGGEQRHLWIGLNDLGHTGTFTWFSGEPVTYTHWSDDQPDGIGSEHFVHIKNFGVGVRDYYEWNTNSDRLEQGFNGETRYFYGVAEIAGPTPVPLPAAAWAALPLVPMILLVSRRHLRRQAA